MLLIACETVFRTGVLAVLYIVATGWDTMKFNFSNRQALNASKCLGIAYVFHSAYFITTDADGLHNIIRVSSSHLIYLVLAHLLLRVGASDYST